MRLAAHGGEFPMDCRICQTFTASPAEPGDLPEELAALGFPNGAESGAWYGNGSKLEPARVPELERVILYSYIQ